MEKRYVYFDNAASTPVDPEVLHAMEKCQRDVFGNPSSVHDHGRKARVVIEQSRRKVAEIINVSPSEVFFTSGGTEANNAVLWGCALDNHIRNIITSPLEHPAVLRAAELISGVKGTGFHQVSIDSKGHIDLEDLARLLKKHPASLVSLMHANNETGNLLAVKQVAALCSDYNALFHSDTVQTIGKFEIDMQKLGFDYAVASAHKFHGPKGAGFMVIRGGRPFTPFIRGGGQERNMRAGTENVCGIAGTSMALELSAQRKESDRLYISELKFSLMDLLRRGIPEVEFNGDAEGSSLHTIINISLPVAVDPEMLLPLLDIEGFSISTGSACASGSNKGSHVLAALGRSGREASLRVSFSRYNTIDEVRDLAGVLRRICNS